MTFDFDYGVKMTIRCFWVPLVAALCISCGTTNTSTTISPTPPTRVVISDFKHGSICGPNNAQYLCTQSDDIAVTGEGHCIYDKQDIACTWYGYSFDYVPLREPIALDCNLTTDVAGDFGTPEGVQSKHATSMTYKLHLDGTGHLFHSQYAGWFPGLKGDENMNLVCTYNADKIFDVEFRLHRLPGASKRAS
jgi:hypothetical protein